MMSMLSKSIRAGVVAALLCGASAVAALDAPSGAPVLRVTGQITETNSGAAADLDIALLRQLGETTVTTNTIWTEGEQTFVGTPLVALVRALGASGGTLRASAVNDYTVEIPVSDAVENGPIIAYERNGRQMSLRDKGPLWIIYPYDDNPAYQSEIYYSRSIWQMDRIEVVR